MEKVIYGFAYWLALLLFSSVALAKPDGMMLAKVYHQSIKLDDYWVSEKYDGVRAYWDGQQLWSRGGNAIAAPAYFTENFPNIALDGELWIARQQFAKVSGIVRSHHASSQWKIVQYRVFDLPELAKPFNQRLTELKKVIKLSASPYLYLVPQFKVKSHVELAQLLDAYTAKGAEGLMLHKGSSIYSHKRNDDLLKLKQFVDAEATVIEHLKGKGKYQDMLGAIRVKNSAGLVFKIGSGFSDAQRRSPPPIGSVITYKYTGETKTGLPRFPVYLRVRSDARLNKN
ncbi:DNA ligase [Catenovulum adriaticum]|uniref:DNA ligase n=1 Tax=Catenovulum adriaticum TaxID=2984846 RepID=A0ABY7AIU1_9ALTE|nr:DNA ligase [Catenovulum sp. TS8]WAJ69508.1 DNA ligase [Catenovulum sp. TS8]